VQNFEAQGDSVVAIGTLTGAITDALGNVLATVEILATKIAVIGGSVTDAHGDNMCETLLIQLGPLHLELLGLVVDLDQITLEISAESGPGNLSGNLLCAVAGLLNPPGPTGFLADLLNLILDALDLRLESQPGYS
jgi:hypothetical protein